MFPTPVRRSGRARTPGARRGVLALSLEVADRGEQVRSQVRGAIVEALTAILLARRGPALRDRIRRERRILFDGVPPRSIPTT